MMTEKELDVFFQQVAAYQDGGLSESELARFERELLDDPQRRRLFAEMQVRSAAISERFRTAAFSMGSPHSPSPPVTTTPRTPRSVWMLAAAVAVAASIAIALLTPKPRGENATVAHLTPPGSPDPNVGSEGNTFATITYASHAKWDGQIPNATLTSIPLNKRVTYRLSSGAVRLSMDSGAIISLAGPASFTGIGPDEIELEMGKLAARMPTADSTLVVHSGGTTVRDRGTAFGLTAKVNGDVDLSVFDGSVSVERESSGGVSQPQTVQEGESIACSESESRAVAYSPEQYEDIWPLTIGVDEASNLIDFVPPGPLGSLDKFANDSKLLLIPETMNYRNETKLSIAAIKPSESYPENRHSRISIRPGKLVSSYLLIYLPVERWEGNRHTLTGSVSFQKPIIGVVVGPMALAKSDRFFGNPEIDYENLQFRYLEDKATEDGNLPADSLRVSDDGKTLHFQLNVGAGQDNLRVLVDETPSL
ncbi:hypothetical protein FHS27_005128 [Rhodopirellula rubra]|uniref:FecR protein domain-containing protein n=1 Tax=Aporhodopirellula rubra TaxID=980271 RepID=A0A7W5H8B1_9BACT|nr:FecR domain-containing protein [Aporhodopirellula rubra]MBB3209288.1 hypothetical protein [Aporhodopirellula rubra]